MSSPSVPLGAPGVLGSAPSPVAPRSRFHAGLCLREAWSGTWPSLLPWFGFSAAMTAALVAFAWTWWDPIADAALRNDVPALESELSRMFRWYTLGWLALGPSLGWGMVRFALNALERRARFADLLEGFARIRWVWPRFAALGLALSLIALPLQALLLVAGEALGELLITALVLVWLYGVLPRFYLAGFFLVDQGQGPLQSIASSWRATRGHTLTSVALVWYGGIAVMLGALVLGIGAVPASLMAMLMWASAYRQVGAAPGQMPARAA